MSGKSSRFIVYDDPDEAAFQRSLTGAAGSADRRRQRDERVRRSPFDGRTAASKAADFLRDSAASLAADSSYAECVPFRGEIPAYEDMDGQQTSYYLFWRRNALDGRFLTSDEGYVLILCYELINRIIGSDARGAAAVLFRLAEEYAPRFPYLARALPRWIEDFYASYLSIDRLYADLADQDGAVAALFDAGRFIPALEGSAELTFDDIAALTGFSEKRSVFANNWDQMNDYREVLPEVFAEADVLFRSRGSSLLRSSPPYSRRAFPGAIYAGEPEVTTTVIDMSPGPQRDHFARLSRLTELLMAERMGYGNKRMSANIGRIISQMDDAELAGTAARRVEEYFR